MALFGQSWSERDVYTAELGGWEEGLDVSALVGEWWDGGGGVVFEGFVAGSGAAWGWGTVWVGGGEGGERGEAVEFVGVGLGFTLGLVCWSVSFWWTGSCVLLGFCRCRNGICLRSIIELARPSSWNV